MASVKRQEIKTVGRGDRTAKYGDPGCNVCVRDVVAQFRRLGQRAKGISGRMRLRIRKGERLPPRNARVTGFGATTHMEGLARVPDRTQHNWFVMTRATGGKAGASGFLLARMGRMDGNDGERMIPGIDKTSFDKVVKSGAEMRFFVTTTGTHHTGGLQMLGSLLLMPVEAAKPRVEVYDLANKGRLRPIQTILLPSDTTKAHYVAAARLENGLTLVLVNRANNGVFDLFLSDRRRVAEATRWLYLGRDQFTRFKAQGWYTHKGLKHPFDYQNANLVTECGSGRLFLFALRQTHTKRPLRLKDWKTANKIDLFRVDIRSVNAKQIRQKAGTRGAPFSRAGLRSFENRDIVGLVGHGTRQFASQDGARMRGAASVHATPSRKLIVYAGPHTGSGGKLSIGEITAD